MEFLYQSRSYKERKEEMRLFVTILTGIILCFSNSASGVEVCQDETKLNPPIVGDFRYPVGPSSNHNNDIESSALCSDADGKIVVCDLSETLAELIVLNYHIDQRFNNPYNSSDGWCRQDWNFQQDESRRWVDCKDISRVWTDSNTCLECDTKCEPTNMEYEECSNENFYWLENESRWICYECIETCGNVDIIQTDCEDLSRTFMYHHDGIDLNRGSGSDDEGDRLFSVADGVVYKIETESVNSWGKYVWIKHMTPLGERYTRYYHLESVEGSLNLCDEVKQGQLIGYIGGSPYWTPHLHLSASTTDEDQVGYYNRVAPYNIVPNYLIDPVSGLIEKDFGPIKSTHQFCNSGLTNSCDPDYIVSCNEVVGIQTASNPDGLPTFAQGEDIIGNFKFEGVHGEQVYLRAYVTKNGSPVESCSDTLTEDCLLHYEGPFYWFSASGPHTAYVVPIIQNAKTANGSNATYRFYVCADTAGEMSEEDCKNNPHFNHAVVLSSTQEVSVPSSCHTRGTVSCNGSDPCIDVWGYAEDNTSFLQPISYNTFYCTEENPCGEGEGHCGTNQDCEEGHVCLLGYGPSYGPGGRTNICWPYSPGNFNTGYLLRCMDPEVRQELHSENPDYYWELRHSSSSEVLDTLCNYAENGQFGHCSRNCPCSEGEGPCGLGYDDCAPGLRCEQSFRDICLTGGMFSGYDQVVYRDLSRVCERPFKPGYGGGQLCNSSLQEYSDYSVWCDGVPSALGYDVPTFEAGELVQANIHFENVYGDAVTRVFMTRDGVSFDGFSYPQLEISTQTDGYLNITPAMVAPTPVSGTEDVYAIYVCIDDVWGPQRSTLEFCSEHPDFSTEFVVVSEGAIAESGERCPAYLGGSSVPRQCTEFCPCGQGMGHCEDSSECKQGFACIEGAGESYGFANDINVCELAPERQRSFYCGSPFGSDIDPESLCREGEGHCATDVDCELGLVCAKGVGANYGLDPLTNVCEAPNNTNVEPYEPDWSLVSQKRIDHINEKYGVDWDLMSDQERYYYLHNIAKKGEFGRCSVYFPCGKHEGHCNSDAECQDGLYCDPFGYQWVCPSKSGYSICVETFKPQLASHNLCDGPVMSTGRPYWRYTCKEKEVVSDFGYDVPTYTVGEKVILNSRFENVIRYAHAGVYMTRDGENFYDFYFPEWKRIRRYWGSAKIIPKMYAPEVTGTEDYYEMFVCLDEIPGPQRTEEDCKARPDLSVPFVVVP